MAPAKKRNVSSTKSAEQSVKKAKVDLNSKVESILESRKHANDVFDILELLQVEKHNTHLSNTSGNTLLNSVNVAVVTAYLLLAMCVFAVGKREGCDRCCGLVQQVVLRPAGEKTPVFG